MVDAETYSFRLEWLDTVASLRRYFKLIYFEGPKGKQKDQIQLVDMKSGGIFLKRIKCPTVELKLLRPGAKVVM